ncbi:MAG: DUF805 domain-containing protein [Silicimonas sp.]
MGFQEAVKKCFSEYITFTGRAARSELWWFVLFILLGNLVFSFLDRMLFGSGMDGQQVSILGALFSLVVFLPSIAVGVRRLHDLDKSGWWYLLILIPLLGALILIFFFVQKGTTGPNRFGEDPLAGAGGV